MLQGLGAVTLFWTALAVTIFPDALDAGMAGLAMNYSMQATGTLQVRGAYSCRPPQCSAIWIAIVCLQQLRNTTRILSPPAGLHLVLH